MYSEASPRPWDFHSSDNLTAGYHLYQVLDTWYRSELPPFSFHGSGNPSQFFGILYIKRGGETHLTKWTIGEWGLDAYQPLLKTHPTHFGRIPVVTKPWPSFSLHSEFTLSYYKEAKDKTASA